MTKATDAFESYLDHLDSEGIKYKLDETARNVLVAIDMHLNKINPKRKKSSDLAQPPART